jgi:hypothetical protein
MTRCQRDKSWQRVTDLIVKHGSKLTRRQLDKACSIWDSIAKAVVSDMPAQHINGGGTKLIMKSDDHKPIIRAVSGGYPRIFSPPTFVRQFSPYTAPNGVHLTGYQLAAQKAGLDISTPGLENMSFDRMQELAQGKLRESTEPLRRAAGLHYNTD